MAAQILDWVRKCLVLVSLTAKRAARSLEPRAQSGGDPPGAQLANSDAIRALLAKLRAAEIDATAGMIQMVQLGDVRAAFGEEWPKMAETAMAIAETLLKDRLDQSDILARYLDYGFVVVFTSLNPEMAELRAEALSQEISHLLLKKPELREAFGAHQVTGCISELTDADEDDPLRAMILKLVARSRSKNRQNGTKPVSDSTDPAPDPKAKSTAQGPSEPPPDSEGPPPAQETTPARATPAAPPETDQKPSEPTFVAMYQPMLLVPKQLVGISVGVPRRRGNDGEWLTGQSAYTRGLDGDHNLSLDLFMCGRVVADLQRTAKAGNPSIVASMVHLGSLGASSKFGDMYGQLAEAERVRLILEIVALDPNTPISKIQEVFGLYRSFTKNIVLHVDVTNTDFGEYAAAGVGAVGCHLNHGEADGSSDSQNVKLVEAFGSRAREAGLRCHIHGIDDEATYAAAIAAGAQYIGGGIIGPLVDGPFAPYPFTAPAALTSSDAA
jgi:GGDEF domain-containing protein